jgi:hypothetical protein
MFSGRAGNQAPELEIDRLWGISGGFLDRVAVIIQMEAGCWRGCCMIGGVVKDMGKPAFQDVRLHLGRQR